MHGCPKCDRDICRGSALDVILLLEIGSLTPALKHLMQQLLGHMCALLPAGLLLQRSAQRVMRSLRRWLAPTCAITSRLREDIVQNTKDQLCLSAKHNRPRSATAQLNALTKVGQQTPLQPHSTAR